MIISFYISVYQKYFPACFTEIYSSEERSRSIVAKMLDEDPWSKWIRTPFVLSPTLSDQYPWEKYKLSYPSPLS